MKNWSPLSRRQILVSWSRSKPLAVLKNPPRILRSDPGFRGEVHSNADAGRHQNLVTNSSRER